jgi:hypothetical protein
MLITVCRKLPSLSGSFIKFARCFSSDDAKACKKVATVFRSAPCSRETHHQSSRSEFERKFIDFRDQRYKFPEINPIDLQMPDLHSESKMVRLANYRWPCERPSERKGIIQYIHGYGDYSERMGFFANQFALNGYDFVCMDQRGYGYSGGRRGIIESLE